MSLSDPALLPILTRIAESLERLAPPPPPAPDFAGADGFLWHAGAKAGGYGVLQPVGRINCIPLDLLVGIDHIRDILVDNTRRFAEGHTANNVLLWGARGMGKSSLVKAAHGAMVAKGHPLKLTDGKLIIQQRGSKQIESSLMPSNISNRMFLFKIETKSHIVTGKFMAK